MKSRAFAAATELRIERLRVPLTLAQVALKAGVPFTRASIAERDPDAHPADASALRRAIAELVAERDGAKA